MQIHKWPIFFISIEVKINMFLQVILLQQQLEEKDRTVRLLQQQLSQALHVSSTSSANTTSSLSPQPTTTTTTTTMSTSSTSPTHPDQPDGNGGRLLSSSMNAATQTERVLSHRPTIPIAGLSRTGSIDDGLGPTVRWVDFYCLLTVKKHLNNFVTLLFSNCWFPMQWFL